MCIHCEALTEDKDLVHRFFEVAATRFNERLPAQIGMPLNKPITADDIEPVMLTVNAEFWRNNPLYDHGAPLVIDALNRQYK